MTKKVDFSTRSQLIRGSLRYLLLSRPTNDIQSYLLYFYHLEVVATIRRQRFISFFRKNLWQKLTSLSVGRGGGGSSVNKFIYTVERLKHTGNCLKYYLR